MIYLYYIDILDTLHYKLLNQPLSPEEWRCKRQRACQLLIARGETQSAALLETIPFELYDATNNKTGDRFSFLFSMVSAEQYLELGEQLNRISFANAILSIANTVSQLHHNIRFITVELDTGANLNVVASHAPKKISNIVSAINESSIIDDLKDGMTYKVSNLAFRNTGNVFSKIACTRSLVIKKPRYVWMRNFRRSVIDQIYEDDVRLPNWLEKNISKLGDTFPEFFDVHHNVVHEHFLSVHKLQYLRIKEAKNILIPESRFVLVVGKSFLLKKKLFPVIVQEKVKGIPLIEMFDQNTESIKPQYVQFLPTINPILRDLEESKLRDHFNWYIGNFLYNPDTKVISYVDPKPSCIFMELENEQNIQGLREVFFASEKNAFIPEIKAELLHMIPYNECEPNPSGGYDLVQASEECIDIDGNVYKTAKIGEQLWMSENLKVTHYRNGDSIPNVASSLEWGNLSTGALCVYDNNNGHTDIYGYLYNWYAVKDSRNVAPAGWHIPSDEEWKQLEMYLGMSRSKADTTSWRGTDEGGKLKESGTTHWDSPNTGATNKSSFSALPGGSRDYNGYYRCIGGHVGFWSSTDNHSFGAWFRLLNDSYSGIYRSSSSERSGCSIRCVRD